MCQGTSTVVLQGKSLTPLLHETEKVIKEFLALLVVIQLIQLKDREGSYFLASIKSVIGKDSTASSDTVEFPQQCCLH